MIVPSSKLVKFINSFKSNSIVAKNVDIDEATLSKILTGNKNVSSSTIESFLKFTGWKFDEAFDLLKESESD